jgi:hypothetical protein
MKATAPASMPSVGPDPSDEAALRQVQHPIAQSLCSFKVRVLLKSSTQYEFAEAL